MRLIIILCLLISPLAQATSWLDKIKSEVKEVVDKVTKGSEEKKEAIIPLPTDIPANWSYSYFDEPVFDSKIAILQTGIEHKNSILLVHGLGQLAMKDWYSVIPNLAKKYHVIAIDLPGFGYSEKPKGQYSPTNYAKVLAAVTNKYAKGKLTVMGHSMGGAVSLRFAAMKLAPIEQLILVDVAGVLQKTAFVKNVSKLEFSNEKVSGKVKNFMAQVNDFGGSMIEMASINSISEAIESSDLTRGLVEKSTNVNAAYSLIEEDFSAAIRQIKNETLIIWGALDKVAPLRTAKVLENYIVGAKLMVIDGSGHVPMKTHQQEFLQILNQWSGQVLPIDTASIPAKDDDSDKKNLICKNENGKLYSGHFSSVEIKNCDNIQLKNITTAHLNIEDSLVNIEGLVLEAKKGEIALQATESVVNMTNVIIRTDEPIALSGSRLDIAGGEITSQKQSIKVTQSSRLVFSVSHIEDSLYRGNVHGAFKLENDTLSPMLVD